jgi:mono/diheme cytochrome c family protein
MSMHKALAALALLGGAAGAALFSAALAGPANTESPGLGKPIAESDLKAWDIAILPDGTNLPDGSGTPQQGAAVYAEKCVACHAENGKGGAGPGAGPLV